MIAQLSEYWQNRHFTIAVNKSPNCLLPDSSILQPLPHCKLPEHDAVKQIMTYCIHDQTPSDLQTVSPPIFRFMPCNNDKFSPQVYSC